MLKEQAKFFNRINLLTDVSVIILSFFIAYFTVYFLRGNLGPVLEYVWVLLFSVPVFIVLMQGKGFYDSIRRISVFDIVTRLINVHLFGGVLVAAAIAAMIHPPKAAR